MDFDVHADDRPPEEAAHHDRRVSAFHAVRSTCGRPRWESTPPSWMAWSSWSDRSGACDVAETTVAVTGEVGAVDILVDRADRRQGTDGGIADRGEQGVGETVGVQDQERPVVEVVELRVHRFGQAEFVVQRGDELVCRGQVSLALLPA